jgi:hypothetical protein
MGIYKGKVKWAMGTTELAVETTADAARTDLYTAAEVLTGTPVKALRLVDVKRSNRQGIAGWAPIRRCESNGEHWAWQGEHVR